MFASFKNHPFAVEAFFESSLVLTFAIRKEEVLALIPECLQLDTFKEQWAFIAVAMVQTKALRPKGFPKLFGSDFFLIGYRVFVRFTNKDGRSLRGLYILRSETDKKKMEFFGNIFTHYNYSTTDIHQQRHGDLIEIRSHKSGFQLKVQDAQTEDVPLPAGSPFSDWKEARRFAGPLPFTFTYDPVKKEVLVIEGVRQNWKPRPVRVIDHSFAFIEHFHFSKVKLANAFIISNIPYCWKKGKIEPWRQEENFRAS
ncbi:MAG TPA: DUF2071 domain-containing protein [Flavisolibacter sp.]|nr:DUF2071 domain-containing protein [Flavisolibacter sp.]